MKHHIHKPEELKEIMHGATIFYAPRKIEYAFRDRGGPDAYEVVTDITGMFIQACEPYSVASLRPSDEGDEDKQAIAYFSDTGGRLGPLSPGTGEFQVLWPDSLEVFHPKSPKLVLIAAPSLPDPDRWAQTAADLVEFCSHYEAEQLLTILAYKSPIAVHYEDYPIGLGYGSADLASELGMEYCAPTDAQQCDLTDLIHHFGARRGLNCIGLQIGLESYLPNAVKTHPAAHAQLLDALRQFIDLPESVEAKLRRALDARDEFGDLVTQIIEVDGATRDGHEQAVDARNREHEKIGSDPATPTEPPLPADQNFLLDVLKGLDADDDEPKDDDQDDQ